jgi:hypothetical protein
MFSFKQLYEFNNLYLNKSFLRKRTRNAEEDIASIWAQINKIHAWQEDMDNRTDQRFADVKAQFDGNDQRNQR